MTTDTTDARLPRLRATRARLEAQLADPKTPAYSVAPLSNQLRLTDKEIERIVRREEADDDGLPTTPERATLLDFMRTTGRDFGHGRRSAINEYGRRYEAILDEWEAAGFVTPPAPWRDPEHRHRSREDAEAARNAWVDACRAELTRCLDNYRKESP